jgi:hypothetical protein
VLDDPPRVADRLALQDEHWHTPLISQRLNLGSAGAPLWHDDLLEGDAFPLERTGHAPART